MYMPTVEAKEGYFFVFFVTGKSFKIFFCSVSKEDIGKAGFFDDLAIAIDDFYSSSCGIEGGSAAFDNVIVGFLLSAVCGTKSIPMGLLFGLFNYSNLVCRLRISFLPLHPETSLNELVNGC